MGSKMKRVRSELGTVRRAAVAVHQERGILAARVALLRIRLEAMNTDEARAALAELDLQWPELKKVLTKAMTGRAA